jgi:hypothetical protein
MFVVVLCASEHLVLVPYQDHYALYTTLPYTRSPLNLLLDPSL